MENELKKVKVGERFAIEVYASAKYKSWWLTELSGGAALESVERTSGTIIEFRFCAYKTGKYFVKFRNFDVPKFEPGDEIIYDIVIES